MPPPETRTISFDPTSRRLIERIAKAVEESNKLAKFRGPSPTGPSAELLEQAKDFFDDSPESRGSITYIGEEAFTDGDVISYQGENFYRFCAKPVTFSDETDPRGVCVLPANHGGIVHMDWDGNAIPMEQGPAGLG